MKKNEKYDLLLFLLGLQESSRSNLSKKAHKRVPTTPIEDLLFTLNEKALSDIVEFLDNISHGAKASLGIALNFDQDTRLIESSHSSSHAKYIIAETTTEVFQTFIPKNKSIRTLFDESFDKHMIKDELDDLENDREKEIIPIEKKVLHKKLSKLFVEREHKKLTEQKKSNSTPSKKKTIILNVEDYLYNRYICENICYILMEEYKNKYSSEEQNIKFNDEIVPMLIKIGGLHPSLTYLIANEWFEHNM